MLVHHQKMMVPVLDLQAWQQRKVPPDRPAFLERQVFQDLWGHLDPKEVWVLLE